MNPFDKGMAKVKVFKDNKLEKGKSYGFRFYGNIRRCSLCC